MEAREAFVALNMIEHVGPVRVRQLLDAFGDAPSILRASRHQLTQVDGIGADTAEAIATWEKNVDLAAELKRIEEFGYREFARQALAATKKYLGEARTR